MLQMQEMRIEHQLSLTGVDSQMNSSANLANFRRPFRNPQNFQNNGRGQGFNFRGRGRGGGGRGNN